MKTALLRVRNIRIVNLHAFLVVFSLRLLFTPLCLSIFLPAFIFLSVPAVRVVSFQRSKRSSLVTVRRYFLCSHPPEQRNQTKRNHFQRMRSETLPSHPSSQPQPLAKTKKKKTTFHPNDSILPKPQDTPRKAKKPIPS